MIKKQNVKKTDPITKTVYNHLNGSVEIAIYDFKGRKKIKMTLMDAFVIYADIYEDDHSFRLIYPYVKYKDKWYSKAYCFDKELNKMINEFIRDNIF